MQTAQGFAKNQKIRPPKIRKTNSITEQIQIKEDKDQRHQKMVSDSLGSVEKKSAYDNSLGSENGQPEKDLKEGNQNIMRQFASAWKSESGFSILLIQKLSLIVNNYFRMIGEMAQRNDQIEVLIVYNKTLIEILNKFEDQQRKILQKLRTMEQFNIKIMKQLCAFKKRQFSQPQLRHQESLFSKFSLSDVKYTPPPKDEIREDDSYKVKLLQLFRNYLLEKNDHYLPTLQLKIQQIQQSLAQKHSLLVQSVLDDLRQLHKDIIQYNKGLSFVDSNNMFDLYEMKCSIKTQMKNLNIEIDSVINEEEQKKQKQFVNNVLKIQAGLTQMNEDQLQTYLRKQKQVRKKIKKQRLKEQDAFMRTWQHIQNQNIELKKDIQQLRQKNNTLNQQLQRLKAKQQFKNWKKNKSGSAEQSVLVSSQLSQENQSKLLKRIKILEEEVEKAKEDSSANIKQLQEKRALEIQNEARRRLIIQTAKNFNIILQPDDSIIRNMEVLLQNCLKKAGSKQLIQSDNLGEAPISPSLSQIYSQMKHLQDEKINSKFLIGSQDMKIEEENKDFRKKKQNRKQLPRIPKPDREQKGCLNQLQKKQKQELQRAISLLEQEKQELLRKICQAEEKMKKNQSQVMQLGKDIETKDRLISNLQLKQQQDCLMVNKLMKQIEIKDKQRSLKQDEQMKIFDKVREREKQFNKKMELITLQMHKLANENRQLVFYNQCAEKLSSRFMKAFEVLINQDITSDKYLFTLDKLFQKLKRYLTEYKKQTKKQNINSNSISLNSDDVLKDKSQPAIQGSTPQKRKFNQASKQYRDFGVNVAIDFIINEQNSKGLNYSQSLKFKKIEKRQQKTNHFPFVQSAKSVDIKFDQFDNQKTVKQKQINRLESSGESARKIEEYDWKPICVLSSEKEIKDMEYEQNNKNSSSSRIPTFAELGDEKKESSIKKQKKNMSKNKFPKASQNFKKASLPIISYSPSLISGNNQVNQNLDSKKNRYESKYESVSSIKNRSNNQVNNKQINQISSLILKQDSPQKKEIVSNSEMKLKQKNICQKENQEGLKSEELNYQISSSDSPIKIRINSPNLDKKSSSEKETDRKGEKQKKKSKQRPNLQTQKKAPSLLEQEKNKKNEKEEVSIKNKSQKLPQFPPLSKEFKQQKESREQTISIKIDDKSNFNDSKPPQMVNLQISLSQEQDYLYQELQLEPIGNSYINNTRNINPTHNRNLIPSGNNSRVNNRSYRLDRSAELAGVQAKYVQLMYQRLQRLNNDTDVLDFYELYQRYKQAMSCLYKSEQVNRLNQIRYLRFIEQVNAQKQNEGTQSIENQLYYLLRRVREQQALLEQQKIEFQSQIHRHILDSQKNIKETLKILRKQYNQNKAIQQTKKFTF